mmetsp:Transcript_5663/g.13302  ORF Transcript_5663/g.13302 Transcript_5663/m.13302 type:complete len:912 (-) Transcript_5663:273-3008(-)
MAPSSYGKAGRKSDDSAYLRIALGILLPAAVFGFQVLRGEIVWFMVIIAAVLGVVVAAMVRNPVVATVTSLLSTGWLLAAVFFQEHPLEPGVRPAPSSAVEHAQQDPHHNLRTPAKVMDSGPAEASFAQLKVTELAPMDLQTMSVVLPCAFEGQYAVKTVRSVLQYTEAHRLKEVIVVDDGSTPPLKQEFPKDLLQNAKVRFVRHETTEGLISAKKSGGDAALGDVIVFFDCHIKPRKGWEEAFLKQMKRGGDHRTVVVPTITSLDPDTWEENNYAAPSKACYMTWNADFTWLGNPGREVPLMSGGLLALSRRWWQETEGYDPHMVAWGGENIDQSLRAWLCGGRIEIAEGAFVAHMWRDPKNPKTALKYPMKTEDVMRNKARAVYAWLGEFKAKTQTFPEYEAFVKGEQSLGDMSNFDRVRNKLKCKPFSAYIKHFDYVYLDTGLVPTEVYQLREEKTHRCLERTFTADGSHLVILAPCAPAGESNSGGTLELQLWHGANKDNSRSGGGCCSGIMNWNFLQCLDGRLGQSKLHTTECEISGHAEGQHFRFATSKYPNQISYRGGSSCLAPSLHQKTQSPGEAAKEARSKKLAQCSVRVDPIEDASDHRFLLRGLAGCVALGKSGSDSVSINLVIVPCDVEDDRQAFVAKSGPGGAQIVSVHRFEVCLDAGAGHPLAYQCYEEEAGNPNQLWSIEADHLVWDSAPERCMHETTMTSVGFLELPPAAQIVLRNCVPKKGQRLKKQREHEDGSFHLQDEDSGKCLGAAGREGGGLERHLTLGDCGANQRWKELKEEGQVQHVALKFCVDAGDEINPIVYPCHEKKAQRKQRFSITEHGLQLASGWEDNGRKRYFSQCIDYDPDPLMEVTMKGCDSVQRDGFKWTKINSQVPLERHLWDEASKNPIPAIGGDSI